MKTYTICEYIKITDDDTLYKIFELVIEEINKRKGKNNMKMTEEQIAKQYGDEALFFTLCDIQDKCKQACDPTNDNWTRERENFAKEILEEINLIIVEE